MEAGTPLKRLNAALAREGLSLTNMGDIMEQTVSGADQHRAPTARAATRPRSPRRSRALELVTADGSVLTLLGRREPRRLRGGPDRPRRARRDHRDHLRRGAGLPAHRPRGADDLRPGHRRVRRSWSPRTSTSSSTGSRTPATATPSATTAAPGPAAPPGRVSGWIEDELLSNGLFQVACSLGRAVPAAIPGIARISSRALSARTYTDIPYKVFTSPRRVRFVEMEYAVPREAAGGGAARAEGDGGALARCGSASRWRSARPPRTTSRSPRPRAGRARTSPCTCTGARRTRRTSRAVERIMTAHDGRPHWGKIHTRDAGVPRRGLSALRRVHRPARPPRPGPAVRQRLPAARPGRLSRPGGRRPYGAAGATAWRLGPALRGPAPRRPPVGVRAVGVGVGVAGVGVGVGSVLDRRRPSGVAWPVSVPVPAGRRAADPASGAVAGVRATARLRPAGSCVASPSSCRGPSPVPVASVLDGSPAGRSGAWGGPADVAFRRVKTLPMVVPVAPAEVVAGDHLVRRDAGHRQRRRPPRPRAAAASSRGPGCRAWCRR